MIRVDKDLTKIPKALLDKTRKEKHRENCDAQKFACADNHYKLPEIKEALDKLYYRKCAYCEKDLLDTDRPVEHYRPKNANAALKNCDGSHGYYWLGLSWDNLLLACTQCNRKKGSCFDIEGDHAVYLNEALDELHKKSSAYDSTERPMLINPEREPNLEKLYTFKPNGKYETSDPRMRYTINTCDLERNELIELRARIKNDLISDLHRCFLNTDPNENIPIRQKFHFFRHVFERFILDLKRSEPLFAWRNYLWNNIAKIIADHENPIFRKEILAAWLIFRNTD